ncbi:feruloyl esterase B precursor [Nemania sp. FL0916]|nr:feruloyl esterase B precursor [Nemania sp. FL0916]
MYIVRSIRYCLTVGILCFNVASSSRFPCNIDSFQSILEDIDSPETAVIYATSITQGGSSFDPSPEYPTNATTLPNLCAVKLNFKSFGESSYNLGIFLPDRSHWNSRLMATGNGGFGGGINYPDMGEYTHYGFATVSTDTGHLSDIEDSSWALNHPESIVDWSYRALHGSVWLAKQIVSAYYANAAIKYTYYTGCATGGRQGLRLIQLYPHDFDGILVGDAAWQTTHLQSWSTWLPLQNYPPESPYYIGQDLFGSLAAQITKHCDVQDGIADSIIQDPANCTKTTACVTETQLLTLQRMFSPYTINNSVVFPGLSLGSDPSVLALGTNAIGYGYFQDFIYNDTSYNFTSYTDNDYLTAVRLDPGRATAKDFDISAFRDKGGKIIMYHGYADGLIPTESSIEYVKRTMSAMNLPESQLSSFLRLFLIPGMNHCLSSVPTQPDAPWYIAAASQIAGIVGRLTGVSNLTHSVPGYMDAKHDSVLALMRWVEEGVAPDELIATKFANETAPLVQSQRTLCPWPAVARFVKGDRNLAENWVCS